MFRTMRRALQPSICVILHVLNVYYDVSALHQRQTMLATFHVTPRSVSDALYFSGYGQHVHAASICQTGRFNTCACVKAMIQN